MLEGVGKREKDCEVVATSGEYRVSRIFPPQALGFFRTQNSVYLLFICLIAMVYCSCFLCPAVQFWCPNNLPHYIIELSSMKPFFSQANN